MFTGIIEEVGRVISLDNGHAGARLTIASPAVLSDAALGSSIAVNGTCLTATEISSDQWTADLAPETLERTNLSDLQSGDPVNLERPLRANSRLDGHFVLGHVDGIGTVESLASLGDDNWWLQIRVPSELARYIVSKGSLAVDGISLTVARVEDDLVNFTVIPHTYHHTALQARHPGSRVNLEVDILAKHLEKLTSYAVSKVPAP